MIFFLIFLAVKNIQKNNYLNTILQVSVNNKKVHGKLGSYNSRICNISVFRLTFRSVQYTVKPR